LKPLPGSSALKSARYPLSRSRFDRSSNSFML
jgi:hypothetical protein